MNKLMKNKKKKGFTLVELIAVIAIIGILAAIIVPMVGKYTDKAKISKTQEEIRQGLMALETAAADTGEALDISALATTKIGAIGAMTGEPYDTANTIVNLTGLKRAAGVTLGDARAVINGDSKITKVTENEDGSFSVTIE